MALVGDEPHILPIMERLEILLPLAAMGHNTHSTVCWGGGAVSGIIYLGNSHHHDASMTIMSGGLAGVTCSQADAPQMTCATHQDREFPQKKTCPGTGPQSGTTGQYSRGGWYCRNPDRVPKNQPVSCKASTQCMHKDRCQLYRGLQRCKHRTDEGRGRGRGRVRSFAHGGTHLHRP